MGVRYFAKDVSNSDHKGEYYAVFDSGLTRCMGGNERDKWNALAKAAGDPAIPTIEITDKQNGNRLFQLDQALRGYAQKRT